MSESCKHQFNLCHSCMAPLDHQGLKGPNPIYCKYCTDERGNLKSYEEVLESVSQFFIKDWQKVDAETARIRARHYLKAMPAWADK